MMFADAISYITTIGALLPPILGIQIYAFNET